MDSEYTVIKCMVFGGHMDRSLNEMTLEELWTMFPIVLSEHKDCWHDWFEEEQGVLATILSDKEVKISHIGSTAISHICAKPIVDILVELPECSSMTEIKEKLVNSGYLCMSEASDRVSFNKGYTSNGFSERVFHLHLRYEGDHDELYFRDYMNENPEIAEEYEILKLSLWKKFEHDRDAYTEAKSSFVEKYTKIAKEQYKDRYSMQ